MMNKNILPPKDASLGPWDSRSDTDKHRTREWLDGHRQAWDQQYLDGRYINDPPEPFTTEIIKAARELDLSQGLYVGCGNGRNFLPLVDAGLDLQGLDISPLAIEQIVARRPDLAERVTLGNVSSLSEAEQFDLVIGIQVFMFGTRSQTHQHLREAMAHVRPGGIFCLRANAIGTDVWPSHHVIETNNDSSFTVIYDDGPKEGLAVHFFSEMELTELFQDWDEYKVPHTDSRERKNGQGQWTQWEAVWRRPLSA